MKKIELELEKAIGDSRLLGKKIEKKIKNLEKTLEAHKKLKHNNKLFSVLFFYPDHESYVCEVNQLNPYNHEKIRISKST